MGKTVIVVEKYCDWLDSYTVIAKNPNDEYVIHFMENGRNDIGSLNTLYREIVKGDNFKVTGHPSKSYFINDLPYDIIKTLEQGDVVAMPFVRYLSIWKSLSKIPKGIRTIHMSEGLPETFGQIGYRIGFRGKKLKSYISLPYAKLYSMLNKADVCYFQAYPRFKNPFAKETHPMLVPPLVSSKNELLKDLIGDKKRPLILGGFGYDVFKMAAKLGIEEYIASSKGPEIIIDGKVHPLKELVSAEEILLSRNVSKIIGYTSNVILWAKLITPDMPITCYAVTGLNKFASPFFGWYAKKTFKRYGIIVKPEDKDMLTPINYK